MNPVPRLSGPIAWVSRHGDWLWWVHSFWSLSLGIGLMWLGSRHYAWLRVAIFHLSALWLAGLFVPALVDRPDASLRWRTPTRLVINYVSKNFYQQILFFLLPIYWASTSPNSANVLFVVCLAVSAVLSTLDLFYDRQLSVRRGLTGVFYAFNLFAAVNVMLPVVWSVSNASALWLSALVAFLAFLSIAWRGAARPLRGPLAAGAALLLLAVVGMGRWLIPPAPLKVAKVEFGSSIDRLTIRVSHPLASLDPLADRRVLAVTAIQAPLGLEDRVSHQWYLDGRLVYASPFYTLQGGRSEGFRLWTGTRFGRLPPGAHVRLDVVTEAGQLIGRSGIRVAG